MFAIVEFAAERKEVDIVPLLWIVGSDQSYWPKKKNCNDIRKMVKDSAVPNSDMPLYPLRKILHSTGKSFNINTVNLAILPNYFTS